MRTEYEYGTLITDSDPEFENLFSKLKPTPSGDVHYSLDLEGRKIIWMDSGNGDENILIQSADDQFDWDPPCCFHIRDLAEIYPMFFPGKDYLVEFNHPKTW